MLFKEFGGVDAFPICLATKDLDEIVADRRGDRARSSAASTSRTSPRRAASRSRSGCASELDIPVFHDDQHGTAVVVLAALLNALKVVGKRLDGRPRRRHRRRRRRRRDDQDAPRARASRDIIGCDRSGALYAGRPGLTATKARVRGAHQPARAARARADDALAGADVFIGLSGPGAVTVDGHRVAWPTDAIVFAMANPTPEIAAGGDRRALAAVDRRPAAPTTRTRSTTCSRFPGHLPRRARRARSRRSPTEMKLAAAHAIAAVVEPRRARARLRDPERVQPRGRPGGRARRRRSRDRGRRREAHMRTLTTPAGFPQPRSGADPSRRPPRPPAILHDADSLQHGATSSSGTAARSACARRRARTPRRCSTSSRASRRGASTSASTAPCA